MRHSWVRMVRRFCSSYLEDETKRVAYTFFQDDPVILPLTLKVAIGTDLQTDGQIGDM